ncbi:hypothetical protein [Radiobacillus sp. PE A8.2]|uniref:YphA family membrane protein n=1 Tax=Radiobacillus sp. PE A8.2 TaxID=3380349 RepID=UPI00388DD4BE
MTGILFYWIAWMLWVITTFLMRKSFKRTFLAAGILITILSSQLVLDFNGVKVNVSIAIIFIWTIIALAKQSDWFLSIFRCLCIVFGYIGILFWEQITPVWMIASRELILPLVGLVALWVLSSSNHERVVIWCMGTTTGEVLHSFILQSYGFQEVIGDMAFFDTLFVGLGFLSITFILKEIKLRMDLLIQIVEKQKKGVNP